MTMKITLEIENGEDVLRELCSLAMDEIQGNGGILVGMKVDDVEIGLEFHYQEWRTCGKLTDLRVTMNELYAYINHRFFSVTFSGVTSIDEYITNFLKNHML